MALSQSDKHLLYVLQYSGDEPISKVCRKVGIREGTAQGKLNRWISSGVLQQRAFINTFLLGASEFEVYFSPSRKPKSAEIAIKKAVMSTPGLRWFYRLAGRYDYSIGLEARNVAQVAGLLESLDGKFPGLLSRKEFGGGIGYWWFGRRYLAPSGARYPHGLEMVANTKAVQIDDVDHRILQVLGSRQKSSTRDLARALGLPQSTVAYRVRQLTSSGVIAGAPYLPSPSWLGVDVFRLLLSFRCFSQDFHQRLFAWARRQTNLVSMLRVLGNWDYTLRFEVRDPAAITEICDDLKDVFSEELVRCEVISVVNEYAFTTYPQVTP